MFGYQVHAGEVFRPRAVSEEVAQQVATSATHIENSLFWEGSELLGLKQPDECALARLNKEQVGVTEETVRRVQAFRNSDSIGARDALRFAHYAVLVRLVAHCDQVWSENLATLPARLDHEG